jgi:hypothetical protein
MSRRRAQLRDAATSILVSAIAWPLAECLFSSQPAHLLGAGKEEAGMSNGLALGLSITPRSQHLRGGSSNRNGDINPKYDDDMRRFAQSLQDGRSFDVLSPMTPQPLAQSGTRNGLENNPLYFSPHGARENHSEDSSLRFLAPAYFGVLACRYMRP